MVEHTQQGPQKVEFGASHVHPGHDHGAIYLGNIVVCSGYDGVHEVNQKGGQILGGQRSLLLVISWLFQSLASMENHGLSQSPISVLGKDRLSHVALVLLIETLSMLDGGQSLLINVELKVLQNSGSLATLPLSEIQQGLAFASVWVFAGDPGQDLLGQDLVHPERSTCSLPVKAFDTLMVEMRVVHVAALQTQPCLFLFEQKLIFYDRAVCGAKATDVHRQTDKEQGSHSIDEQVYG